MRKIAYLLICLGAAVFFSCTRDEIIINEPNNVKVLTRSGEKFEEYSFLVTEDMAIEYVKSIIENPHIISIEPVESFGVVCYYIINLEKGWIAISSDMRTQPVIGKNDFDHLYPQKTDNPGLKTWLELNSQNIYSIKKNGTKENDENIVKMWQNIRNASSGDSQRSLDPQEATWVKVPYVNTHNSFNANVDRLISTHWGQKNPWNCTLPMIPGSGSTRFVTGCVSTAVSQILYYYHCQSGYPNDFFQTISPIISGTTSDGGYKLFLTKTGYTTNSSKWSNMPLLQSDNISFNDVSDLMMLVGVKMNATYYPSQETSTPLSFTNHLLTCNISSQKSIYNYNTVKNNLLNGDPVIVTADQPYPSNQGHAWIIDGCYDCVTTTDYYSIYYHYVPGTLYPAGTQYLSDNDVYGVNPNAFDGMSILESSNSYQTHYLRMNYGWADNADYGAYTITGSDWEENLNQNILIFYNLSTGQLGNN